MNSTDWITKKSADTLDPAQVQNTLEGIANSWPAEAKPLRELIEQFPLGESALLHLISVSSAGNAISDTASDVKHDMD